MKNGAVHVVPYQGKWAVRKTGHKKVSSAYETRQDAIAAAREMARRQGAHVIVHRPDGMINNDQAATRIRVTVSGKNEILLPSELLLSMGVFPGEEFVVIFYDNRIELVPVRNVSETKGFIRGIDTTVKRDKDRA
jgi:hypothetical protein